MTSKRRRVAYLVGAAVGAVLLVVVAAWACEEPWIDMGSPEEGATVSGNVSIEATPSTGGGASAFSLRGLLDLIEVVKPEPELIQRVEFVARGKHIATVTGPPPYTATWDTTKFHDGHCALVAHAYGATGQVPLGRSRTVHVTVANLLSIDSPAKREQVSDTATISGSVAEGVDVTEIRLYVEGERIATLTESPFSVDWDTTTVEDGEHIVRVRIYDGKKQLGHSAVRVVVNNN